MGVIYKLTSKTSGKSYVGQTKHTTRHRWNQHVWEARNPQCKQSRYLNRAIVKYGPDDFNVETLWCGDDSTLDEKEVEFIEKYNTFGENGYNLTKGGKANQEVSCETRALLSEKLRGKPKNVKDNRKRTEDNYLPKYLRHYTDTKGQEGYRVCGHPNLKKHHTSASIAFTKSDESMEQKFLQAMDVLDKLNSDTFVYESKTLPVGIQSIPNGYRVRCKGHPVKTFQSSKASMEEKLLKATEYLQEINRANAQRLNVCGDRATDS